MVGSCERMEEGISSGHHEGKASYDCSASCAILGSARSCTAKAMNDSPDVLQFRRQAYESDIWVDGEPVY